MDVEDTNEFEDFASDAAFSDVDVQEIRDQETADDDLFSEDEIASVLDLLGGHAQKIRPRAAESNEVAVERSSRDARDGCGIQKTNKQDTGSPINGESSRDTRTEVDRNAHLAQREQEDLDRFLKLLTAGPDTKAPISAEELNIASGASPTNRCKRDVFGGLTGPSTAIPIQELSNSARVGNNSTEDVACPVTSPNEKSKARQKNLAHMWGKFTAEKMPVRRDFDSLRLPSTAPASTQSIGKVIVLRDVARMPNHRRQQTRAITPEQKEFTFRPKINTRYYRYEVCLAEMCMMLQCVLLSEIIQIMLCVCGKSRRRKGAGQLRRRRGVFTLRMKQDIIDRQVRLEQQAQAKSRNELEEERALRPVTLVATGSRAILERNGLWNEPINHRLERLVRNHKNHSQRTAEKTMRRRRQRDAEVVKSRACEALYQRGVERMQQRQQDHVRPNSSSHPKMTKHSQEIVRKRLDRDVKMICLGAEVEPNHNSPRKGNELPCWVSFVEFSCALLYFGLVPAANTSWKGDPNVTLLWYAWTTFADGEGEMRRVSMNNLKQLLNSVILQGPIVPQPAMPGAKVQLLQLFRTNYLARKRAPGIQMESQKKIDCKRPNQVRNNQIGASPQKQKGDRGHPTHSYSIHGKRVDKSEEDFDQLAQRHLQAQNRIEQLRRAQSDQEVEQCTFQPNLVNGNENNIAAARTQVSRSTGIEGYTFRESLSSPNENRTAAFDRLYEDAFTRQSNSLSRAELARLELQEREKKEQRVSPSYVNGMDIDERLHRLQEALASNTLPASFHKTVASMRAAQLAREKEKLTAAHRALRRPDTATFEKTKGGHTVVCPFRLETAQRQRHRTPTHSLTRPLQPATVSAHILSKGDRIHPIGSHLRERHGSLRDHYHDIQPEDTVDDWDQYNPRMDEEDAPSNVKVSRDTIIYIDVHVSPMETYELIMSGNDDPHKAASEFAITYDLDPTQHARLLKMLNQKLKQLIDL